MKFYSDISKLNFSKIAKNVHDLQSSFLYLCLLPKNLKEKFLGAINDEARKCYGSILLIEDEFCSNMEEADYILFPPCNHYIEFKEHFSVNLNSTLYKEKKIIFSYFSSDDRIINLSDNMLIFRGGGYKSLSKNNVYASPYIVADYYNGKLSENNLSISFCGLKTNNKFRENIIDYFLKYDFFDCIVRDKWAGDSNLDSYSSNSYLIGSSKQAKLEYIENIQKNLYGLVVRGTSNATSRLSDIFMMGRIPIILDTDWLLPFEKYIPYEKNAIIIKDFNNIVEQINSYHSKHNRENLIRIQLENRNIWEEYFKVENSFEKMKNLIDDHYKT